MKRTIVILVLAVTLLLLAPPALGAAIPPDDAPGGTEAAGRPFPFNILGGDMTLEDSTTTMEILILLTILSLAPSILIMVTAFIRIVIVLSFTRSAMGTQQMPPNQVMIALALFLTLFIMFPVFDQIKAEAWDPYAAGEIAMDEFLEGTMRPLRGFMLEQIRLQRNESDLMNFMNLARLERPGSIDDIPTHVLVPAFITSELKTGFIMGFIIYIPFIIIDMVVASALMSMGMMMLPPVMISLPFKIMIFVAVDGWNRTVGTIVDSFHGAPG
ncbi:MAG: flagellar type III secretion system pore protein FliP [Oscillospiraceae bacterium]|nr:flagellar type III secretion system pore protein FliP [Oscillospiraceae bacterium]